MKALVFGGTRFMGRYVAQALLDAGWAVTVANRGTRAAMPAVESVCCDRSVPGALDALRGRKFDAVIDFSAYSSSWVAQAGAAFAGNISRYIFISSCAVYSESQRFPVTEDFPLAPPPSAPAVRGREDPLRAVAGRVQPTRRISNRVMPAALCAGPGEL
jgi:2'-hydroxyisoflavone reductase